MIKLLEVLYDEPTGRLAVVFELMDMDMDLNMYGKNNRGRRRDLNVASMKDMDDGGRLKAGQTTEQEELRSADASLPPEILLDSQMEQQELFKKAQINLKHKGNDWSLLNISP